MESYESAIVTLSKSQDCQSINDAQSNVEWTISFTEENSRYEIPFGDV